MPGVFGKLFAGSTKGPVRRRHSLFGDYVTGDTSTLSEQEYELLKLDVAEYNKLWQEYADSLGLWGGSIPTEKGFRKWLRERGIDDGRATRQG